MRCAAGSEFKLRPWGVSSSSKSVLVSLSVLSLCHYCSRCGKLEKILRHSSWSSSLYIYLILAHTCWNKVYMGLVVFNLQGRPPLLCEIQPIVHLSVYLFICLFVCLSVRCEKHAKHYRPNISAKTGVSITKSTDGRDKILAKILAKRLWVWNIIGYCPCDNTTRHPSARQTSDCLGLLAPVSFSTEWCFQLWELISPSQARPFCMRGKWGKTEVQTI